MAENSLFPCALRLFYRTPNAPHVMTVPLNDWSPISGGHPSGTNLAWDASQVDTDTMVNDLVTALFPFWGSTTAFTSYQIDTFAAADAPARPQVTKALTAATGSGSGGIPAAQATMNFKTDAFGVFKLVMLDAQVSATFQPIETLVSPADDDYLALVAVLMDSANAFAGRDGHQISLLKRVTFTLNEKLRKSYRLD